MNRRALLVTACVLAVGLLALGGVSSTVAAQDEGELEANVTFDDDPSSDSLEFDHTVQRFALEAKHTTAASGPEDLTFNWNVEGGAGDLEVEEDAGDGYPVASYSVTDADVDETVTYELTVTDENTDETDTDSIDVSFLPGDPTTSISYRGDEDSTTVEFDESTTEVVLSASGTRDPHDDTNDLDYDWKIDDDVDGDFDTFGTAGRLARFVPGDGDEDLTFDVTLTVTNRHDRSDTAAITLSGQGDDADDSSGGGLALPGPGGSDDTTTTPGPVVEDGFTIDSIDAPSAAEPGEELEVTVGVHNDGDDGTAELDVVLGDGSGTAELDLDAGESGDVTVPAVAPSDPGEYTLTVLTQDDERTHSLVVEEPQEDDTTDDTESTDSGFGMMSLVGAVFILALVGVAVRRVLE